MLQSELSYVRQKLRACPKSEWTKIAEFAGVSRKTIKRMADDETIYPRSDNTGKVALYFRTQEMRTKKR